MNRKIRMLVSLAGADFSYVPGQEVMVSEAEAGRLIAAGMAEGIPGEAEVKTVTETPASKHTAAKKTRGEG